MDILRLKKRLNDLGFGKFDLKGPEALIYGPKTTKAVLEFQKEAELKDQSGIVGPETLGALFPDQVENHPDDIHYINPWESDKTTLAERALDIFKHQVGVKEVPDNSGPAVSEFLGAVGLGVGFSWCMAFMYWGFQRAAKELGVNNPLVKTGGCMRQWNEIPDQYKFTEPKAGDIFIMDLGGGAGHTGIVTKVNKDGTIETIEGNTNENNSPNGDGVYVRTRKILKIKGFIRL